MADVTCPIKKKSESRPIAVTRGPPSRPRSPQRGPPFQHTAADSRAAKRRGRHHVGPTRQHAVAITNERGGRERRGVSEPGSPQAALPSPAVPSIESPVQLPSCPPRSGKARLDGGGSKVGGSLDSQTPVSACREHPHRSSVIAYATPRLHPAAVVPAGRCKSPPPPPRLTVALRVVLTVMVRWSVGSVLPADTGA